MGRGRVSNKRFFEALYRAYVEVRGNSPSPYVPIPLLRARVCEELGISPEAFDKRLSEFPVDFGDKMLDFAAARWRRPGGITRGVFGRYLYYLAIFDRGEGGSRGA